MESGPPSCLGALWLCKKSPRITPTHRAEHGVGAPTQEPNLPVNGRVNYHPYFLAQHFAGRLKAFAEDFPSLAGTACTNFCFTQTWDLFFQYPGISLLPLPIAPAKLAGASKPPAPGQALPLWGDTAYPYVLTLPMPQLHPTK